MVPLARFVVTVLALGLLTTVPSSATAGAAAGSDVVSRKVVFEVQNTNGTSVACSADGESYRLRGRLVGPRDQVLGSNVPRLNVLVHDMSTGSWFWNLRKHPRYDYATKLARRGETSLVLDRLGYDASPLADGNGTCLGAQADMLHQVVQHARSGKYEFRNGTATTPGAHHVVTHGHSVGAAIAQLEAATYDDVDGLVLMSWSDSGASQRAVDEAAQQSATCLEGQDDYALYAPRNREYRKLHFVTAPRAVQRRATSLRNADPCGDALSLSQMALAGNATTNEIEAPVLLLFGSRDALNRDDAAEQQEQAYPSSERVVSRTVEGAGNALTLERSAPQTRRMVNRWLATLD